MISFCRFLAAPHNPALQALIEEQKPLIRYNDYALLTGPAKRCASPRLPHNPYSNP